MLLAHLKFQDYFFYFLDLKIDCLKKSEIANDLSLLALSCNMYMEQNDNNSCNIHNIGFNLK